MKRYINCTPYPAVPKYSVSTVTGQLWLIDVCEWQFMDWSSCNETGLLSSQVFILSLELLYRIQKCNRLITWHWAQRPRCDLPFLTVIDMSWSPTQSVFISPVKGSDAVSWSAWMDWFDWHALYLKVMACVLCFHLSTVRHWRYCLHCHPAFSLQETQWLPYLVQRLQHKHCDGLRDTEHVCMCVENKYTEQHALQSAFQS